MGYTAFGTPNATSTTVSVDQRYTYTGREQTTDPNLMYYRYRMYGSGIGRFVQRDPIGYGDGIGIYTYVYNSPLNYFDRMGQAACDTFLKEWNEAAAKYQKNEAMITSLSNEIKATEYVLKYSIEPKIESLKEQIANASGTEKAALQQQLSIERSVAINFYDDLTDLYDTQISHINQSVPLMNERDLAKQRYLGCMATQDKLGTYRGLNSELNTKVCILCATECIVQFAAGEAEAHVAQAAIDAVAAKVVKDTPESVRLARQ